MNKGGSHTVRGVRISMTDARHASSVWPDDSHSGFYTGEPVGLVFHLETGRIYFAGDTDVFGDMALIRRLLRPDSAVLPVGDRTTMGLAGAAIALELLDPRICIPCYYGTWPGFFTGTPDDLRSLTDVPVWLPDSATRSKSVRCSGPAHVGCLTRPRGLGYHLAIVLRSARSHRSIGTEGCPFAPGCLAQGQATRSAAGSRA